MDTRLTDVVQAFADLHVLVVGEAMLDSYLRGDTGRLCREAPVPIVDVQQRSDAPGGAANTAANLRALGARVSMLGVIGADAEGDRLVEVLERLGVETDQLLRHPGRRTLAKCRVVAGDQMLVRFDQGSTDPIDERCEDVLAERLRALLARVDAVTVSDYGYGILGARMLRALGERSRDSSPVLVVDAKDSSRYQGLGVSAVKPNEAEAWQLLGGRPATGLADRADAMLAHGDALLEITGAANVAVTLDTEGAVLFERNGHAYRTYAEPAPHSQAAGAGDTFTAALTLALAAGAPTPAAAELASGAAAVVVRKPGTSVCSADELRSVVSGQGKVLEDRAALAGFVRRQREAGRRVVFTNGCFDLIHRGHVGYLSRAKALGDVLIVGVNSDGSVARLKGPQRPVNPLDDRAQVLAALSTVDLVVPFDEDTPEELLRIVRPDVFAKGGDYTHETLPEAALVESQGGEVCILPYLEDRSTTEIIRRIRLPEPGTTREVQARPA